VGTQWSRKDLSNDDVGQDADDAVYAVSAVLTKCPAFQRADSAYHVTPYRLVQQIVNTRTAHCDTTVTADSC